MTNFVFSRTSPTGRLVDISGDDDDDEEDVAVKQFGGLKVGFTPDMHASHRPRRVCHSSVYINILLVYLVMSTLLIADVICVVFQRVACVYFLWLVILHCSRPARTLKIQLSMAFSVQSWQPC